MSGVADVALGVATGGLSEIAKRGFKSATPDMPSVPTVPEPPDSTAEGVQQAKRKQRQRSATGRSSTLLTGPGGVSAPAPTRKKTLLGG